ncbi:hypothetical protein [Thiobacillus sp.]
MHRKYCTAGLSDAPVINKNDVYFNATMTDLDWTSRALGSSEVSHSRVVFCTGRGGVGDGGDVVSRMRSCTSNSMGMPPIPAPGITLWAMSKHAQAFTD